LGEQLLKTNQKFSKEHSFKKYLNVVGFVVIYYNCHPAIHSLVELSLHLYFCLSKRKQEIYKAYNWGKSQQPEQQTALSEVMLST